ncbi:hypothetical protein B0H14DRAFT_3904874 [Mycena olivaceomarginata]|nr:hypothetical protein B0H14DRAFT_3904874 [Mycena olivaceomarginata]
MSSGGPQSLAVSLGYIRASWYGWSSFNGFRSPLRPLVPAHYCDRSENYSGAQRFRPSTAVPSSTAPSPPLATPARAAHSARPRAGPGGLQVSETFLETLYMRPARAHPPPPLRRLCACCPAPAAHGVPAPASLAPFLTPLVLRDVLYAPACAHCYCADPALACPAPASHCAPARASLALAPAAVALTHRMLPRPRRTSLGPFLCPSRFSGPPSLRIVYPHVSCHMWHAPVRRPPLLRSQPPLARPLRVPTVAPIQRTLARPDPWN